MDELVKARLAEIAELKDLLKQADKGIPELQQDDSDFVYMCALKELYDLVYAGCLNRVDAAKEVFSGLAAGFGYDEYGTIEAVYKGIFAFSVEHGIYQRLDLDERNMDDN